MGVAHSTKIQNSSATSSSADRSALAKGQFAPAMAMEVRMQFDVFSVRQ
jgi:hypothetical protein